MEELNGLNTIKCYFSTQEITGMENGKEVTNSVLQAISEFSQAVLIQANKFPQIAAVIEKRDIEESQRWNH